MCPQTCRHLQHCTVYSLTAILFMKAHRGWRVQVLGMMDSPHYLYRMTVLVAVAALAPVVSHDVLCNSMLPVVVSAAKDKVLLSVAQPDQTGFRPYCPASSLWSIAVSFVAHALVQTLSTGACSMGQVLCQLELKSICVCSWLAAAMTGNQQCIRYTGSGLHARV